MLYLIVTLTSLYCKPNCKPYLVAKHLPYAVVACEPIITNGALHVRRKFEGTAC